MADRFALGIVGVGRMGKTHIDALKDSSQVVVTATVDPRPEVRKDLEEQGLATFATVDDLLNDGLVDGVLIAAPTDLHRELISVMAGAGIPALCEKPCGVNTSEASACVAITEQVGVPFQIAYWRRYVGALAQLRDRIQSGELGDVLAIQCEQWDESPPPPAFRQRSGGIFVDMGVHEFDQIRWLTGQEFDTVKAVTSGSSMTGPRPDDPDCAQVVASLSGGATGVISLGRWHPAGDSCRVDVYGTKATVTCWFLQPSDEDGVFKNALRRQAEDFAELVRTSRGGGATARDAVAALTVAEQADKDARSSRWPV